MQALREGTLARRFVPVLCGSAAKAIGMQPLLDAAIDYLASASDLGVRQRARPEDQGADRAPSGGRRACSPRFVFKTIVDPFAGKLSVFRVLSGKVTTDSTVLNVNKDTKERLGHLFEARGQEADAR